MNKILFLSLTLFVLINATSCSKEKRVERQLSSQDGTWKITSFKFETFEDGFFKTYQYAASNTGTIVFTKDGSGTFTNTYYPGYTETNNFTWTNTDRKITMIQNNEVQVYFIDFEERKKKVLVYSEEYELDGYYYKDRYTYTIEKQ